MRMDSKTGVFTPFILFREGEKINITLVKEIIKYLRPMVKLDGLNFGNAYNKPIYLLGELESCDEPLVFLVNWNERGELQQKCLISKYEICELMKALEHRQDEDSWHIAMEVNARIRKEQGKDV